uniref:Uncharacterized protein n=1 Tax=Anguilla anguilla TaxID=7936 RepID=A0A0E9VSU8_ANGAN
MAEKKEPGFENAAWANARNYKVWNSGKFHTSSAHR